jgi:hypothetical protein
MERFACLPAFLTVFYLMQCIPGDGTAGLPVLHAQVRTRASEAELEYKKDENAFAYLIVEPLSNGTCFTSCLGSLQAT